MAGKMRVVFIARRTFQLRLNLCFSKAKCINLAYLSQSCSVSFTDASLCSDRVWSELIQAFIFLNNARN